MTDSTIVRYSGDWILYQGAAVSGALLYVYDAGTSDLASIYTDKGLTVASANPVTADSGGLMPFAYRGTGNYKVVIKTSSGTTIDSEDNLPGALDTSTFAAATFAKSDADCTAKTSDYTVVSGDLGTVLNVNPTSAAVAITLISAVTATNGRGLTIRHTGTANQVNIATVSSQTIDGLTSKSLLGEYESVELVSDGANWHIKSDANRTIVGGSISPHGYLTLTSATPVIASDVSAGVNAYYTPLIGNLVPTYDGTRFILSKFSELTLALASQHALSTLYDVFIFLDPSDNVTVRIGTGPAWSVSTAGSGARGTGAGTTELTRTPGLYVNNVAITARNGASTYSVAANKATYVGTLSIDATAGQITNHVTYGQSRKWGVWNAYNRQPLAMQIGDTTSSWTYNSGTIRASNNASANSGTVLRGLPEEPIDIDFRQNMSSSGLASTDKTAVGIGVDSTTVASGFMGRFATGNATFSHGMGAALHRVAPGIGINVISCVEQSAGGTTTFFGGNDDMLMMVRWRG